MALTDIVLSLYTANDLPRYLEIESTRLVFRRVIAHTVTLHNMFRVTFLPLQRNYLQLKTSSLSVKKQFSMNCVNVHFDVA